LDWIHILKVNLLETVPSLWLWLWLWLPVLIAVSSVLTALASILIIAVIAGLHCGVCGRGAAWVGDISYN